MTSVFIGEGVGGQKANNRTTDRLPECEIQMIVDVIYRCNSEKGRKEGGERLWHLEMFHDFEERKAKSLKRKLKTV